MKNVSPSRLHRADRGAALVLVLCFVVLLTGLAVAYFSRTMVSRQLSNASTTTAQTGTIANGAVDIIVGALKQEIVNGSDATVPPGGRNAVYFPRQDKALYAVPQRQASPAATATGGPLPNLIRRSAGSDAIPGNPNYLSAPALTSYASAASSANRSVNGRLVSMASWNRHYLLPINPATGGPTAADPGTPVADFVAPDWVFVTAEKGPSVLSAPSKDAGGNAVTVTGRYAYAVYDEGGLLDINHTGYPSTSSLAHVGAKPAPGYADLTQLGLSADKVDNLLGWRNYATLQATGDFPDLRPSATRADEAYYRLFVSTPASLVQVPLALWKDRTDQAFLSRRQLIDYFASAKLDQKYLQYFGTFSRSLNQPSYAPEAGRPVVLDPNQGGNDGYYNSRINPSFLTALARTKFVRADGTNAVVGEPLVKKRFPLNRLAWLTCRGPSSDRNPADPDMVALLDQGIPAAFLKEGTVKQIENCFGLRWDSGSKWTYVHGEGVAILNIINPDKPKDVVGSGREPDFFELLKASINPGSLAKPSLSPNIQDDNPNLALAAQRQYKADKSLDRAVLQVGVNIIDQFDTDGFPTKISYSLGSIEGPGAVYGDENLPYISRVRGGLIRLAEADPSLGATGGDAGPIKNTGVAALMNYPELWNPHGWSSGANRKQSFGTLYPRNFKVYAVTNTNYGVQQATNVYTWKNPNKAGGDSCDASVPDSPGYENLYGFRFGVPGSGKGGETRVLDEGNTKMTFTIDPNAGGEILFREPTILFARGLPAGSRLASPALVNDNLGLGRLASPKTGDFFAQPSDGLAGGLFSAVSAGLADLLGPRVNTPYVGFYIGSQPLRWWSPNKNPKAAYAYQTWYGETNDVTYVLACEYGNDDWIEYDMKAVTTSGGPNADLDLSAEAGFGLAGMVGDNRKGLDFGVRFYQVVDPRTNRFGMMDSYIPDNARSIPPRRFYSVADQSQGILKPDRDGMHSGTALNFYPAAGAASWFPAVMGWYHDATIVFGSSLRPGLLAQNNPAVTPNGIVSSDLMPENTNAGNTYPPFYYADADGVVRRAMGGNVPGGSSAPANGIIGLPTAYARGQNSNFASGPIMRQMDSRPVVLNRPFRSVAELGYVFSGTPWKNLDFFQPESGNAALLDIFCVSDGSDASAASTGQVNLNTRQVPVLQAILAQANKDQWNDASTIDTRNNNNYPANVTVRGTPDSDSQAKAFAELLVKRTALGVTTGPNANQGPQPLRNLSDLVGRWVRRVDIPIASGGNATTTAGIDGKASCDGFTADLADATLSSDPAVVRTHNVQRYGEGAIRALTNAGQTRVWNLMFDIVAQTGRYRPQAKTLDDFNVEGEQHCWVHVAIDRYTGQVIDKQVENVSE